MDFQTLEHLYTCLQSIKSWFDVFFKCPPLEYAGFSTIVFVQVGYCILALYRLLALNDPAWDTRFVRNTIDFSLIVDCFVNHMQQARAASGLEIDCEGDPFTKTVKIFTTLKSWWESRFDVDSVRASVPVGGTTVAAEQLPTARVFSSFEEDDPWLKDILGLWEL